MKALYNVFFFWRVSNFNSMVKKNNLKSWEYSNDLFVFVDTANMANLFAAILVVAK